MQTRPPSWPWLAAAFGAAPLARNMPRAGQPAFEAALKRRGTGDDPADAPVAVPSHPAPPPLQPVPEAPPRTSPTAAAEPHAALRQLQALAAHAVEAPAHRWQIELLDATLPVQQLDVQRMPAGTLQVVVSGGAAEALRPQHTERLRLRLAARGEAQATVAASTIEDASSSTEQELP